MYWPPFTLHTLQEHTTGHVKEMVALVHIKDLLVFIHDIEIYKFRIENWWWFYVRLKPFGTSYINTKANKRDWGVIFGA